MMITTQKIITWVDPAEDLPDDDITVLLALADGEVWTGYLDAGAWRFVSGDPVEVHVSWWASFPDPPSHPARFFCK